MTRSLPKRRFGRCSKNITLTSGLPSSGNRGRIFLDRAEFSMTRTLDFLGIFENLIVKIGANWVDRTFRKEKGPAGTRLGFPPARFLRRHISRILFTLRLGHGSDLAQGRRPFLLASDCSDAPATYP